MLLKYFVIVCNSFLFLAFAMAFLIGCSEDLQGFLGAAKLYFSISDHNFNLKKGLNGLERRTPYSATLV